MAYPLTTWQAKVSRIRWSRSAGLQAILDARAGAANGAGAGFIGWSHDGSGHLAGTVVTAVDDGPFDLVFAFPMARAFARPHAREDSASVELGRLAGADGIISAWDQELTGQVPFIPTDTAAIFAPSLPATGWDAAGGWQWFLAFAYQGGTFDFYPDAGVANDDASKHTCQLVSPTGGPPQVAPYHGRALTLTLRDVNGTPFDGW